MFKSYQARAILKCINKKQIRWDILQFWNISKYCLQFRTNYTFLPIFEYPPPPPPKKKTINFLDWHPNLKDLYQYTLSSNQNLNERKWWFFIATKGQFHYYNKFPSYLTFYLDNMGHINPILSNWGVNQAN